MDSNLKSKLQAYQDSKNAALSGSKKDGSIMNRNLNELFATNKAVTANDFVETNSLTTLIAIVPEKDGEKWSKEYEILNDYIVPRSSK